MLVDIMFTQLKPNVKRCWHSGNIFHTTLSQTSDNTNSPKVSRPHALRITKPYTTLQSWDRSLIKGDDNLPEQEPVRYWLRDSLAVLQEILENPELVDHCVWGP